MSDNAVKSILSAMLAAVLGLGAWAMQTQVALNKETDQRIDDLKTAQTVLEQTVKQLQMNERRYHRSKQ